MADQKKKEKEKDHTTLHIKEKQGKKKRNSKGKKNSSVLI